MQFNKHFFKNTVVLLVAVALSACAGANSSDSNTMLKESSALQDILSWWPGDYNNDAQLARLTAQGKPIWRADDSGKPGHIQVESHYRLVDLPQIGEHVLYVEELKHGDPTNVFRQRLYTLTEDEQGEVSVQLWYFNDKKKYVGAWKDLSRLSDVTKDDMYLLPAKCDLKVKKQGDKYHMPMTNKACDFGKNYFNYQVLLGPNSFWFRDKINAVADDSIVSISGDFTYHELDKL